MFFLLCLIGFSLGGDAANEESNEVLSQLILELRHAVENSEGEAAANLFHDIKRFANDDDSAAISENVERSVDERAEEATLDDHEARILEDRGAWEDFKASVKKAGKKVKDAFGKRNGAGEEMEARDEEEDKEEAGDDEMTEREAEMAARGAWEDFKASLKKAGQKIKNAFGKKEEEKREEEVVKKEDKDEEKKELKEADAEEANGESMEKKREEMREFQDRIRRAHYLIKEAQYKREMEREEEEKRRLEEKRMEEEEEERKAMEARGSWDDFKQKLRTMKLKLKERLGRRGSANLRAIRRKLSDLEAIQSALAALKQDAIEAGLQNDPEIIKLIEETEALAHEVERKEG